MTNSIKLGTYTSKAGAIFDTITTEELAGIVGKAVGRELGKVLVMNNGTVLLCNPKPPASKADVAEAKRKGIPAAPVSKISPDNAALVAMQAQIAALMAALAPAAAAPAVKAPAKKRAA